MMNSIFNPRLGDTGFFPNNNEVPQDTRTIRQVLSQLVRKGSQNANGLLFEDDFLTEGFNIPEKEEESNTLNAYPQYQQNESGIQ